MLSKISTTLLFLSSFTSILAAETILFDARAALDAVSTDFDNPASTLAKQYRQVITPVEQLASSFLTLGKDLTGQFQSVSIKIDNTSIFLPGGDPKNAQNGFRRTDIVTNDVKNLTQTGDSVYHFSILDVPAQPLNLSHEYQVAFIEGATGGVFMAKIGTPFNAATLPADNASTISIQDAAGKLLFSTPFTSGQTDNFGIQVGWDDNTIAVLHSTNTDALAEVVARTANGPKAVGIKGNGDYHVGILKLPIPDPTQTAEQQSDVVHFGIQEGTTEALNFSQVFIASGSATSADVTNGATPTDTTTAKPDCSKSATRQAKRQLRRL